MPFDFSNRNDLKALRADMEAALAPIAAKHGINVQVQKISFTALGCTARIEWASITDSGFVMDRDADAFRALSHLYGLQATDLGRTFQNNGRAFAITGLRSSSPKYPILARCASDGKVYKFSEKGLAARLQ